MTRAKPTTRRVAKYNSKQTKLLAAGTCPICLDAAHQTTLANQAESDLDAGNGALFCAGAGALGGDDTGFVPPDANTPSSSCLGHARCVAGGSVRCVPY